MTASDGAPAGLLRAGTRLRVLGVARQGLLNVWVPLFGLGGQVREADVATVGEPTMADLAYEQMATARPPVVGSIGLPARVSGGGNLRDWPVVNAVSRMRTLGHNAPVRVLQEVQGDDSEQWFHVQMLDSASLDPVADGYLHNSVLRLPRLRTPIVADAADRLSGTKWFEADLQDPAMLMAYQDGVPVWNTLTLKGKPPDVTPEGTHEILRRVANEIMSSETLIKPIPRNAPGGYYLKDVLYTQYFTWDGSSIHYNYWSSNFGYYGSHGCLGVGLNEAKWAWTWADIGTPVRVWA
jgi:hypothetical protein